MYGTADGTPPQWDKFIDHRPYRVLSIFCRRIAVPVVDTNNRMLLQAALNQTRQILRDVMASVERHAEEEVAAAGTGAPRD